MPGDKAKSLTRKRCDGERNNALFQKLAGFPPQVVAAMRQAASDRVETPQ